MPFNFVLIHRKQSIKNYLSAFKMITQLTVLHAGTVVLLQHISLEKKLVVLLLHGGVFYSVLLLFCVGYHAV